MVFKITIPVPKIGQSIPLNLITNQDTNKVLSLKPKHDGDKPSATRYSFTIFDENKELIEEVILELQPNEEGRFEELLVDLIYDGFYRSLYITPMPTENLVKGTLVTAIELDVLRINEADDGGWKQSNVRPKRPTPVLEQS